MAIEEVVRKVLLEDHADVVRESVRWVAEQLMESEVSELIGAELGERRPEDRATHRTPRPPRSSSGASYATSRSWRIAPIRGLRSARPAASPV
jgi:transposase-like protein